MFNITDCCICLCRSEQKSLIKLHGSKEDLSYFVKLKLCIPAMDFIKTLTDVLICESCQERVDKMYSFHELCLRSKETLMDYINQLQTDKKTNGDAQAEELKKGNIMEIFKDEVVEDADEYERYNIHIKKEPVEESEPVNDTFPLEFVNCSNSPEGKMIVPTNENVTKKNTKRNVKETKPKATNKRKKADDQEKRKDYSLRPRVEKKDKMGTDNDQIIDEIRNNGADYNINFICETEYNDEEDSNENFQALQVKREVEAKHHFLRNEIVQQPLSIVGRPSQKQDNEVEPTPKILMVLGKDKQSPSQNRSSFTSTLSTPVSKETQMDMSNKTSIQSRFNMKVYTCDTCGKFFAYPSTLKIHQRTHIEEKTFNCEICFKQFTLLSQYKEHQNSHIPSNSYKCKICNSFYYGSSNFNKHLKTHQQAEQEEDGPYTCEICGSMFMQLHNLNKHRQTHNRRYSTRLNKT